MRDELKSVDAHGYWKDHQVLALVDSLKLTGGRPNWKQEHIDRLHDWASAHEKKPNTIDGQLSFVGYQLLNTHEGIGRELYRTQTYDQAKEVVGPFVRLISE
jgi:hypothetical protein